MYMHDINYNFKIEWIIEVYLEISFKIYTHIIYIHMYVYVYIYKYMYICIQRF